MTPDGRPRAAVAAAGAALAASLGVAAALLPLIRDTGWFSAVFVVLASITVSGVLARQLLRWLPAAVAVQVIVFAFTVTALFARDAAVWGMLPGPDVWEQLRALAAAGTQVTRDQPPPVPATRGVLLLAVTGAGVVGLLVDVIAVSLRQPAVAGLPLLAVYCMPTAVLPKGLGWPYFVVAAAGFLVLIGAEAGDRVRAWGRMLDGDRGGPPRTPPPGTPQRKTGQLTTPPPGASWPGVSWPGIPLFRTPLRGAHRMVVVVLALAVVLPGLVPGLDEQLIGPRSEAGNGREDSTIRVVNPILDLRNDLTDRSDAVVLSYRTDDPAPEPLRIVTDDAFDGRTWSPSVGTLLRSQQVQSGMPVPPGLGPQVSTTTHSTQISIGGLDETYLPLPYPATRVDVPGTWLWDADTFNVVGWGVTTRGLSYQVDHLVVRPSPEQLAGAGPVPPAVASRFTILPEELPASIGQAAQRVAGPGNPYQQATRLQSWFRSGGGFTYSETLPGEGRGDSGGDAVASFLHHRVGYCVHFASAMAVMARSLGIPARVAVGFLPGEPGAEGRYTVRLRDAHAWPELYFAGVGWVRFEPTPAGRTGTAPAWTVPQPVEPDVPPSPSPSASAAPSPGEAPTAPGRTPEITPSTAPDRAAADRGPRSATRWLLLGGLAVLLLLAAVPGQAARTGRARRWRAAVTPRSRAETGWAELRERLGDLGVTWPGSATPRTVQDRLTSGHRLAGPARDALTRLVDDLERARYARPAQLSRPAGERAEDVREVTAAVAATVPVGRRLVARFVPPSGLRMFLGAARRAGAAAPAVPPHPSDQRDRLRHRSRPGQG